ncbi:MAG: hypothetical protein R8G33_10665 [Gammaproteobacteria bacterium]|nr:hypothetical protein [Gammaproteobacteria bacterium]
MDEIEYHSTYKNINPIRCVFEKAINSRVCNCTKSARFNLADREGVSCKSNTAQQFCNEILHSLRENARFAIQKKSIDGKLPHNAEIRIQNGAVKGLVKILQQDELDENDIYNVFQLALARYKLVNNFPYSKLMQEISAYQVRRSRNKKK